ncbi:hypothetical protein PHMEG_00010382 [Phytophthora megakarya]|uniref:Uncharacterized protein n=1 Tax=Phytophthora megakarya TaxID=4795 RepID=A0A225WF69_9STRA|nr:hypothetical protein PHMEG_00010382 [Phytophthora megakarya]
MLRAAGNEEPQAVSVPVFLPVLPPKIKSISHEALVKWKKDRANTRPSCATVVVVELIRDSFDDDLLDTFCQFQLNVDSANVTERMLFAEIKHIVESVKNQALPDIKELVSISNTELERDVQAIDFGAASTCVHKEVKQGIRYTHSVAEKDPKVLFRLIVEKATELECQYNRLKQQKREGQGRKTRRRTSQKKTFSNQHNKSNGKPVVNSDQKVSAKLDLKTNLQLRRNHCQDPVRNAVKYIDERNSKKKAKLKRVRSDQKAKKAKVKRLGEFLPTTDRTCPDSGSDHTVVGHSHFEKLKPNLWRQGGNSQHVQLRIHAAVGPVKPMGLVDVLVVDVGDEEFIVGNDVLTALGINVDRQLQQLVSRGDDELAGDPIQSEGDGMPVNVDNPITRICELGIFATVEQLIGRPVDCGFPSEHVEKPPTIAHAYDVGSLELEAEPPANVPPLDVQLRDGARPAK